MATAGLTPFEALRTATRNPAEFLGTIASAGTVEKGKHADLLLLNANPLTDVANTMRIEGVMIGGRWLARDDLDRRLKAAEAR